MIAIQKGSAFKVPVRLFSLLDYVTPLTGVAVTQNIENVTLNSTDPVKITITGHGLATYMTVLISDVVGTTELNGNVYTVTYVDADNFTLVGTDSSQFSAYVSGGKINEVAILISKAGGAPEAPSDGAFEELDTATSLGRGRDGTYTVSLNATDTNTEGPLTVHVDCGRAARAVVALWVVDWTVMGGGATAQEIWEYEERTMTQEIAADAPTVEEIEAHLAGIHGEGSWECEGGGGATAAPTVEEIEAHLAGIHGEGSWECEGGGEIPEGYFRFDYKLTLPPEGTGVPIPGAKIWITSDVEGNNLLKSGYTNVLGYMDPTVYLPEGTYYVWREAAGHNFTNPDIEIHEEPES